MSYRNPKQIVDTQSGQYMRDLQKSLAGTFSDYASEEKKEYERRAKLNEQIVAKSQERINRISGQINQVANANKTTNFDQMYDLLDEYGQYMKINPSKRTREMNAFINNMDNSGTTIKNMLANTTANGEDFMSGMEKGLGVMGGVMKGQKEGVIEKNSIMFGYNQAPGSKKLNFNPRGLAAEIRIDVLNEGGKNVGSSLNADMDNLDPVYLIPDETSDMQELAKMGASFMDLNNPNSPAYKGQPESSIEEGEGSDKYRKSRLPSKEYFLTKIQPEAKAQVDSLTAAESIALYNDVLRKEGGVVLKFQEKWVDGSEESVVAKEIITKAYAEHVADNFAQPFLTKGLKFGSVLDKPDTPEPTTSVEDKGKAFYDKVRKNPISFFNQYAETLAVYDKEKNTITISKEDIKDADEDKVYNMYNPDERISFYTQLLEYSDAASGNSAAAKLYREQFEKALRTGTSKKLNQAGADKKLNKAKDLINKYTN